MSAWPATDEIMLSHGEHTLQLLPSLRAAIRLERLHDGFEGLSRRVDEFHLGTISEIIMATVTNRHDAAAFLSSISGKPLLPFMLAVRPSIITVCRALIPASNETAGKASGKPVAWADYYRELYRLATGWLGWTPEAAWTATPTEITEALAGKYAMLKAIHGSGEDDNPAYDPREEIAPEQAKEGINKLKAIARGNRRA